MKQKALFVDYYQTTYVLTGRLQIAFKELGIVS